MNLKRNIALILATAMILALAGPVLAGNSGKVNINTATLEELTQLTKVGPKYAEKIIEYRKTNGPFKNGEDIMNVKGIGSKIWELNKDRIVVK